MLLPEKTDLELQAAIKEFQEKNPFLPIHQIITSLIREEILSCRLEPGSRMNEEQWAARCAASRTTIRKAFDTLVEEGWLEKREGHGVWVSRLVRDDYRDLMDFRAVIEPAACRLAARNCGREDLKRIETYARACDTTDMVALYHADTRFHRAVFAACRNPYLIQAYEMVFRKLERGKIFGVEDFSDAFREVYQSHMAIYGAIRDRDEDLAERMGAQHVKMMTDSKIIRRSQEN